MEKAFQKLGELQKENLLNSPGNFTASKLGWLLKMNQKFMIRLINLCYLRLFVAKLTGNSRLPLMDYPKGFLGF